MPTNKPTPTEIYNQWRATLTKPDDSMFYYHPSLERIILGLTMYEIASRPLLNKLRKSKSLSLYNIYINEMVTAWIDESDGFDYPFKALMILSETFNSLCKAFIIRHENLNVIRELQYSFCFWCGTAGDISEAKADELLDDISTDGKSIFSDKISLLVKRVQPIVAGQGLNLDIVQCLMLIENDGIAGTRPQAADIQSGEQRPSVYV